MLLIERGFILKAKNGNKIPLGYSKHHRKPKSLGGDLSESNISVVLQSKHKAWTLLFDNKHVPDIVKLFEKYWGMFGNKSLDLYVAKQIGLSALKELEQIEKYMSGKIFTEEESERSRKILVAHRHKMKRWRAWKILFGGLDTIEEIINEINAVWIDPDYKLVVQTIQAQKVTVLPR